MGYGDEIIGTGLARGASADGKKVAFGDGQKIMWSSWCPEIFAHNPNVAKPGSEKDLNLIWVPHYKGSRMYNTLSSDRKRWVWNYEFKAKPGEFFFTANELNYASAFKPGYVLMEPNVPWQKEVAPNKDWGEGKYEELSRRLVINGLKVVQFKHKNSKRLLESASVVEAPTFRHVIAAMSRAGLYIGPEGGMHHAAAAVGINAVVLFGGFIPPSVTGYENHTNLTGGAEACGNIQRCEHCKKAMANISVDEVKAAAMEFVSHEM